MKISLNRAAQRLATALAIPSVALVAVACSGDSDEPTEESHDDHHDHDDECGGHGHLHGDHCDCDSGYVQDPDDEASCIEGDDDEDPNGSGGLGGSGNEPDEGGACAIQGNIGIDELPSSGSVAFALVEGAYRFIKQPGMTDTSISFIDSECKHAYGWSRDKPYDDETARESSWVLDLETMEFEEISIPDTSWVVLRNGRDDGTVVGKLAIDSGTPDDASDDESRGFIHDLESGETTLVRRDGFDDIGFTAISDEGLVVGFNDFGVLGFVYDDGDFTDLVHDDAFRLFPFQITSAGRVVGFWGHDEDTWYDNAVGAGFVAEFDGESWTAEPFALDGYSGTGLTGMNDAGQVTGIVYASATSLPTVFVSEDLDFAPTFHPLSGDVDPFPTGISEAGVVFGQVFILEEPPICGGHGVVDGEQCACDDGYDLDPYDDQNCLAPGAECFGHGHLHGDECHCDDGFKKDPNDAGVCIPS